MRVFGVGGLLAFFLPKLGFHTANASDAFGEPASGSHEAAMREVKTIGTSWLNICEFKALVANSGSMKATFSRPAI